MKTKTEKAPQAALQTTNALQCALQVENAPELKNLTHGQPAFYWKNFARRLGAESLYNAMRHELRLLGFAFRCSEPFSDELAKRCLDVAVACRQRINGRPWLNYWTLQERGESLNFGQLRRSGAYAIHFRYIAEMVQALEEFSGKGLLPVAGRVGVPEAACSASMETLKLDPLFRGDEPVKLDYIYAPVPYMSRLGGEVEAGKVGVLRISYKDTCILIAARNWINPVHRTRQTKDLNALKRLAEAHAKKFKKVFAFLICPKAERPLVEGTPAILGFGKKTTPTVYPRDYPHVQPKHSGEEILCLAYPSGETWSREVKARFANWVLRILKPELVLEAKRNEQKLQSIATSNKHTGLDRGAPNIPMYQKASFPERGLEKGELRGEVKQAERGAFDRSVYGKPPEPPPVAEAAERLKAELSSYAWPKPRAEAKLNVTTKAVNVGAGYKILRSYRYMVFNFFLYDVEIGTLAWVPVDPVRIGDAVSSVVSRWYGSLKTHRENVLCGLAVAASMAAAAIEYYRRAHKYNGSAKNLANQLLSVVQQLLREWVRITYHADLPREHVLQLIISLINRR
jgi:hypothetical protein